MPNRFVRIGFAVVIIYNTRNIFVKRLSSWSIVSGMCLSPGKSQVKQFDLNIG